MKNKIKQIAKLNDQFRQSGLGTVLVTAGIAALPIEKKIEIMIKVREFDDFTEENDPSGERNFGSFYAEGVGKGFWKIDYYDNDLERGSEDPADPIKTKRVLTVMLAAKY